MSVLAWKAMKSHRTFSYIKVEQAISDPSQFFQLGLPWASLLSKFFLTYSSMRIFTLYLFLISFETTMLLCILFTGSKWLPRLKERNICCEDRKYEHLRKRNKWNLNVYISSALGRKEPRKWFSFIFLLIKASIWEDDVRTSRQKAKGSVITRY